MVDGMPLLAPSLGYTGRLYKRARLTEAQLAMYNEGRRFMASRAFVLHIAGHLP
jgi:hypothetical protein